MNLRVLGQNVYRLRAKKGWTQEQLVEAADMSRRHLQLIEAGKMNLSAAIALRLKVALGCELDDLFRGTYDDEILAAQTRFMPSSPKKKTE